MKHISIKCPECGSVRKPERVQWLLGGVLYMCKDCMKLFTESVDDSING